MVALASLPLNLEGDVFVDSQDNMMNLAISNATVTLKTKDLYVPD
jgi:hypothetical protein